MKHPFTKKVIATLLLPAAAMMWAAPAVAAGVDRSTSVHAQDMKRVSNYRGFRASELIGKEVKNPQGEQLGEIEDLVVHMTTGDVRYAILSLGGFLGATRNRIKGLAAEKLAELAKTDELELTYLQMASLNNLGSVVNRAVPKQPSDLKEEEKA